MIRVGKEKSFTDLMEMEIPVLVKFGAKWCGKCMILGNQISSLEERLGEGCVVAEVDADEHKDIFAQYGVTSLPVLILFKKGKVVGTRPGVATAETLADFVKPLLKGE